MIDVTSVFPEGLLKKLPKLIDDPKDEHKHEHYHACCDHAKVMSWHVYGKKPEELLKRARPREDPAITAYRLDSYEPITESTCKKALAIIHKIFDANLYSIRFDKAANSEILERYTTEDYPRFNSVVNYVANFALKKMMADPNAVLLVQPYYYEIAGNQRPEPIVTCYASKDIYLITDEYVLLFDKKEEETRDDGAQIKRVLFTYADKNGIYKFSVTTINGKDAQIETLEEYIHNWNELPVWYLSGEFSDENYGLFESFIYGAVPYWNEAINDHSDVVGGYRNHMWPHKWEFADECEYVHDGLYPCQNGRYFNTELNRRYTCPSCGGSGKHTAKSPLETTLVNRDKFNDPGPAGGQIPFGYVTVPTDALAMLEAASEKKLVEGLAALWMNLETGLNQSGKAKEMDRSELQQFLQRIADVVFEVHLTNIFYFFTKLMFGVEVKNPETLREIEPEISKPTQFDVYSTLELTDQFAKAKEAKVNPSYLQIKQKEIQNKEFQTNPELLARLNLYLDLDPLAEVNSDEVALKIMNKTITMQTAIIHDNIRVFVDRAMEEDKAFDKKLPSEQRAVLEGYADEVVEENKVEIDTSALEPKEEEEIVVK